MHIYLLRNRATGKCYVGLTTHQDVNVRWGQHKNGGNPRNDATYITKAIRKYGWDAFDKQILETCTGRDELMAAERRWITELDCLAPKGYNLTTGGESYELTAEAREARSRAQMGHQVSLATRQKISQSHQGRRLTAEHRQKISEAGLRAGRKLTDDQKRKLLEANSGELSHFSKLNWAKVRAIRADYAAGECTQYELAARYEVSVATISRIVKNKKWAEADLAPIPVDHRYTHPVRDTASLALGSIR